MLVSETSQMLFCITKQSLHLVWISYYRNVGYLKLPGKRNIWLYQINDPGLDVYDYLLDVKLFYASTDAWLLENDYLEESDVVIMDLKDISLKFLTKCNMSVARKLAKYQQVSKGFQLIHLFQHSNLIFINTTVKYFFYNTPYKSTCTSYLICVTTLTTLVL